MNGQLFEELDYCVPLGIPHSHFLGGPDRWNDLDREKVLAYRQEMRKVCSRCHTRREEWSEDQDAYIGYIEYCPGCHRLDDEQDNMPEDGAARRGLYPTLLIKEEGIRRTMEDAEDGGLE